MQRTSSVVLPPAVLMHFRNAPPAISDELLVRPAPTPLRKLLRLPFVTLASGRAPDGARTRTVVLLTSSRRRRRSIVPPSRPWIGASAPSLNENVIFTASWRRSLSEA